MSHVLEVLHEFRHENGWFLSSFPKWPIRRICLHEFAWILTGQGVLLMRLSDVALTHLLLLLPVTNSYFLEPQKVGTKLRKKRPKIQNTSVHHVFLCFFVGGLVVCPGTVLREGWCFGCERWSHQTKAWKWYWYLLKLLKIEKPWDY
jgi:hypothetical protein